MADDARTGPPAAIRFEQIRDTLGLILVIAGGFALYEGGPYRFGGWLPSWFGVDHPRLNLLVLLLALDGLLKLMTPGNWRFLADALRLSGRRGR